MKIGFDHEQYTKTQSAHILKRIEDFGGKLYLEFGGKLFDDYHASRVLPGFQPDSKISMLLHLKDQAEMILVISADDIEKSKLNGTLGISYDADVLRLIDAFRGIGISVNSVVITKFAGQRAAVHFQKRLENMQVKTYRHFPIEGYPADVTHIVSDEGFGRNEFVETTRPLVLVTAPGPGSGKMATCLSQVYQEYKRGVRAGYAKFETFPIWNLPLKHPVNVAYEAATADLSDVNMIDPFHLEAYGETAVNYNRDIEIFPVLNALFEKITGASPYKSPTDMGVNMAGFCITDDEVCCEAARQEIIRRYFSAKAGVLQGKSAQAEADKISLLMRQLNISEELRPVIAMARNKAALTGAPAMAIELPDGKIVTGRTTSLLGPASAALLNAVKSLGGIPDALHLISPEVIPPIQRLKCDYLGNHNPRLHSDETLLALAISAKTDGNAEKALSRLPDLTGCEAHSTVLISAVDENVYRRLGIRLTCDPEYQIKKLYHG